MQTTPFLSHRTIKPKKKKKRNTEDGTLHLHLTKADPGEPWVSAFTGHEAATAGAAGEASPTTGAAATDDTARLLLERFQREHPGFDFSGAQVSGAAPDPRTFLRDLPEEREEEDK